MEVTADSPLLEKGLAFIDTPGVGGHGQPHLSATLGLLPDADAMLMISDTSQEFTEPEMTFLRQAHRDLPGGGDRRDEDRSLPVLAGDRRRQPGTPAAGGSALPVIPASALLRSHALQHNDKELNEESNFPAIVKFLSEKVLSRENERIRDQVLAEIRSAAEHLTLKVDSELSALNDPETRDRLKEELERRKEDAQEALQQTALWQQVLNDGIADLTSDIDHDLRARFRAITRTPRRSSTNATRPITGRRSAPSSRTRSPTPSATTSSGRISAPKRSPRRSAARSSRPGWRRCEMPQIDAREMGAGLGELKSLAKLEAKPIKVGDRAVSGLRGSFGGVLMFGMLTSLAGLGMFNPLSLGAGPCWAARLTRRRWRTGCCGFAARRR